MGKKERILLIAGLTGLVLSSFVLDCTATEVMDEKEERCYVVMAKEDGIDVISEIEDLTMQNCGSIMLNTVEDDDKQIVAVTLQQDDVEEISENPALIVEENIEFNASKKKMKKHSDSSKKKKKKAEHAADSSYWNLQMIEADELSSEKAECNDRIKVAVIDSGIDMLTDVIVTDQINLVEDEQELPYYMNDMTGHGTAVASIISRINPSADIISVRVLDSQNRATLDRIVKAIYWCIDNDVDIINMSFGTRSKSRILEKAIEDAKEDGILLIAAAGNGGENGVEYPAAFDSVIAVGSVDSDALVTDESAIGDEVEIVAPGENVPVESFFGLETAVSGTSMAAPHITGAASVIWQKDKEKSSDFVRKLLDFSAKDMGDHSECGNGLIDLEYALLKYSEFSDEYQPSIYKEDISGFENMKTAGEFDDSAYAEGRWGEGPHLRAVTSNFGYFSFDANEIKLLKAGAVYPDDKDFGMQYMEYHPEWHGYYIKNYVANYIFATKIAKKAGNVTELSKAKGQSNDCYESMKKQFKDMKINGKSWTTVIKNKTGLDYKNQDAPTKEKWRKAFLYGMSIHILTDTFAHSCFTRETDGSILELTHRRGADSVDCYVNRYKSAKEAALFGLTNYEDNCKGDPVDFAAAAINGNYLHGFLLKGITNYAIASNPSNSVSNADLRSFFAKINYD